jgi:glutamate-5-semialdehyde dehydrogenase
VKSTTNELEEKGRQAKSASRKLAFLPSETKNKALIGISRALLERKDEILAANKSDCEAGEKSSMSTAMLDRLLLSTARLEDIAHDVENIASLPDPVGEIIEERTLPNGLLLSKRRVPLGVIGAIYESRPNVTVDISALCLKSGNAVVLRGGKEALHSNLALTKIVQDAVYQAGVPQGVIQFIESTERTMVDRMLKMKDYIDLMIPRGGAGLIKFISENATMPVLSGGIGVCHTYIDSKADLKKGVAITYNAKVQRPTVCNALDTLLVHSQIAEQFLPLVAKELAKAGVEMHCDERALTILKSIPSLNLVQATNDDWGKEFLALIAAIKVVDSADEAIEYIERYGSGHSEAIVTEDKSTADRFLNEVDSACVYANASTRFTDGAQFGLGAEIGISTQKFHARGPMALKEITSYKWVITGTGQVRP